MSGERNPLGDKVIERSGLPYERPTRVDKGNIYGMVLLDADGTITVPGSRYLIDKRTLGVVTEFVYRGGICAVNTGATKERIERTFANPVFCSLDEMFGFDKAREIFKNGIYLLPENGSTILKPKEISIVENKLWLNWDEYAPLHVANKDQLRHLLEEVVVPMIPNSFVLGDRPGEIGRRNYILSLKGLKNVPELIERINSEIIPNHPELDWSQIGMKGARTTIDFINKNSGKEPSTRKLLEMTGFIGPIVGFRDLGDEFAKVPGILTFNVNEKDPNSFRRRGLASLETYNWREMPISDISVSNNEVFFRGEKYEVVRDKNGKIVESKGNVIAALPMTRGAGEATAEILERLMDVGYFNREEWAS